MVNSGAYEVLDTILLDDYINNHSGLYLRIKKNHRLEYTSNQRLVFRSAVDSGCRQMLQNLQRMLHDIDISNYFVIFETTDPHVNEFYNGIHQEYNQDPVPITIKITPGNFCLIESVKFWTKNKFNVDFDVFESLSDSNRNLLFNNDAFCMHPWVGINVEPDNKIRPCCHSTLQIGDASKQTLEEAWNSTEMKQLRYQMLNGIRPSSCETCHFKESLGRDSQRNSINKDMIHRAYKINHTRSDGHLDDFSLNYWDARYNNLCNLACRSCGPASSSSWFKVKKGKIASSPLLIAGGKDGKIFNQIIQHIDHVDQIYFAGGEPLIIQEFYDVLTQLAEKEKYDVKLVYNTNMTRYKLKDQSIFDLWKKFKSVVVGGSLDGEFAHAEYIRQNTKWHDVLDFRRTMMEICPHVDFHVSATVSILNLLHVSDFHKSWVEAGLLDPHKFNIQVLTYPRFLNVSTAPSVLKNLAREKIEKHLQWCKTVDHSEQVTYGFRGILKQLDKDMEFDPDDFWKNINLQDSVHKTNLLTAIPELSILQ